MGGSTPLSKMRIWVASRMPMMWPWMVTVSPARNARTVASSVGKVISWCAMAIPLRFPVVVDGAVTEDVGAGAAGRPALVVDGHRVQGDVGVCLLDVHRQHGGVAAQSHRADAGLVQEAEQLALQGSHVRIWVDVVHRP